MAQLEQTTRELILERLEELQKQKKQQQDILPKLAEKEPRFLQMEQIEILLFDHKIDALKRMIIEDTDEII